MRYAISENNTVLTFTVLTLIAIVVVIAYIVWRLTRRNLSSITLVSTPRKLFGQSTAKVIPSSKMPVTQAGREFAFSFWLYLSDYQVTSQHKLVFMRGATDPGAVSGASPLVYLDSSTNKLYLSIATNQANIAGDKNLYSVLNGDKSGYVTATVEYVPLQRWVCVAFSVRQQLMSVYVDGDLYTIENVGDSKGVKRPGRGKAARPIFAGVKGDLSVGPVGLETASTTGYIARLVFYNYSPSQSDMSSIYRSGPTPPNLMGAFGLSDYGLRSPVYKVDY